MQTLANSFSIFIKAAFLVLTILSTKSAFAEGIKGSFSCDVMSVDITSVKDGEVSTYKGRTADGKKGIQPGNILIINYGLSNNGVLVTVNSFNFLVPHINSSPSLKIDTSDKGYKAHRYEVPLESMIAQFSDSNGDKFAFSDSRFDVEALFIGELSLERYYKEDWNGLILRRSGLEVDLITLDCAHIQPALQRIAEIVDRKL